MSLADICPTCLPTFGLTTSDTQKLDVRRVDVMSVRKTLRTRVRNVTKDCTVTGAKHAL